MKTFNEFLTEQKQAIKIGEKVLTKHGHFIVTKDGDTYGYKKYENGKLMQDVEGTKNYVLNLIKTAFQLDVTINE